MAARIEQIKRFWQDRVAANWQYKFVAFAAAVIMWIYVAGQQSMQVIYTVPIRYQNILAGSQIMDQKAATAEVTLAGRRERIMNLRRGQVWISLDLSGMRNGHNLYLISSRDVVAPAGIEIKDISPSQLSIQLSPIVPEGVTATAQPRI